MAKIGLYVFGTSILWGQGHVTDKKIHIRIKNWLERKQGISVRAHHFAHSGAILKGKLGPGRGRLHGEVPDPYPSIATQIRNAPNAREDKVVILFEGGINDVGIFNIVNPLYNKQKLRKRIREACHDDLKDVLVQLGRKYRTADVFVLGYYQILSDRIRSRKRELGALLCGLGLCTLNDLASIDFVSRAVENTKLFWEASNKQVQKAVTEANSMVSAHVTFVDSGFKPSEGLFARRPLLYGLHNRDPQRRTRIVHCPVALFQGRSGVHCLPASVGHPNGHGVARYERILKGVIT